jgi:hypothetical protein
MTLKEEAQKVLGFHLPEDSNNWLPEIKSHIGGDIDQNKRWNLTLMLLMRVNDLENAK